MVPPGVDESAKSAAFAALSELLGERFSSAEAARDEHSRDVSHHHAEPPDAVAFPETTAEVARIVGVCAEWRIPVIPFGTGTAVEGGVLAVRGGVCIDLSHMNRVLSVNPVDMDVTVEAGVTRHQLNHELGEAGHMLYFAVDPGADASLGGMAATRASGSAAVRYGTMRDNVLGLTAVLADGRIIRTGGRARKSSAGYDLTRLLVGSEGTLGIITEVTVKLHPIPEAVSSAVCPFDAIDAAVNAVMAVMAAGIPLARIELLDEVQMDAVNRYSGLNYEARPTLFFEFHGSQNAVVEQAERVGEIIVNHGGGDFAWATDKKQRDQLWQARYDSYYASLALRPGGAGFVTDVCVPISKLAECVGRAKEYLKSTQIPAPLFGHVGDGNYHVVFVIEPDNARELDEVRAISRRLIDDALACGGTCTGEHGIGLGKLDALVDECGPAVDVMRTIKRALDPHNIMNPGKVLRAESA
jgi:D-lactate dehydrogenase (cytochrome)